MTMRLGMLMAVGMALGACGTPEIVVEMPLGVVNVAPHDGAVSIDPAAVPAVCFSEAMDAARAASKLGLVEDGGPELTGQTILASDADRACLSIAHPALRANTTYLVRAKKGLTSATNKSLAADVTSRFRTAP